MIFPSPGIMAETFKYKDWRVIATLNSFIVFLISGLTLQNDEFADLLKKPISILYGVFAILFVTPLLSLITQRLPLQPKECAVGLSIFCIVPTTLSGE
jgi:solute carrier family 10 (sodium/bile acid cotransporter), member 7